jgi:hypothetical protein
MFISIEPHVIFANSCALSRVDDDARRNKLSYIKSILSANISSLCIETYKCAHRRLGVSKA